MEWQYWAMVAMFFVGGALPAIGLVRVYRKSVADFRDFKQAAPTDDGKEPSFAQFNVMTLSWHRSQLRGPVVALRDAMLVGGGLALGTAASIWAVVDTGLA